MDDSSSSPINNEVNSMRQDVSSSGADQIPVEATRWNWGAFLLTWIWGIGNQVWISLLMFIPFFNLIWWIVLGAKGSQWAWKKGHWKDVAHFKRVQRNWAIVGLCIWVAAILFFVAIFSITFISLGNSEIVKMSLKTLNQNTSAQVVIGKPIVRDGLVMGEISIKNGSGHAKLHFSVKGDKGQAKILVKGIKRKGVWRILELHMITPKQGVLNLTPGSGHLQQTPPVRSMPPTHRPGPHHRVPSGRSGEIDA